MPLPGDGGDRVRLAPGSPTGRGRRPVTCRTRCCPRCTTRRSASGRSGPTASTAEILYPSPGLWDAIKQIEDAELKLGLRAGLQRLDRRVLRATTPTGSSGWRKIPVDVSVDDAQDELLRCVNELGLRGGVLDAWPSGAPTVAGNPDDDPFWETVNELRVSRSASTTASGANGRPRLRRASPPA